MASFTLTNPDRQAFPGGMMCELYDGAFELNEAEVFAAEPVDTQPVYVPPSGQSQVEFGLDADGRTYYARNVDTGREIQFLPEEPHERAQAH
jgi:hypothetical protein